MQGLVNGARDQAVDLLVTDGSASPVTMVGGVPMLAPDAWMTPGTITPAQVEQLRALPGVEVAAPVTYLDLASDERSQTLSTLLPVTGTDDNGLDAWRAEASYSVTDGTGTHTSDPTTLFLGTQRGRPLLDTGARAYLHREAEEITVRSADNGYSSAALSSSALSSSALSFHAPLVPSPSSLVALDPQAEAALARAAGAQETAEAMDTLADAWQRMTTLGTEGIHSVVHPYDPDLTYEPASVSQAATTSGIPVPVVTAASGALPTISVSVTAARLETADATLGEGENGSCPMVTGQGPDALGCTVLTDHDRAVLSSLSSIGPGVTSAVAGPAFLWRHPAHPFRLVEGQEPPASGLASFPGADLSFRRPTQRTLLLPLSRRTSSSQPAVELLPARAPTTHGQVWQEEVYRPTRPDAGQYLAPGLIPVATYHPERSSITGADPLAATTLATAQGQIAPTLNGTGAVTAPAATVLPDAALDTLTVAGRPRPTAGTVRLRLTRDADGCLPQSRIEEVASRVASMGLTPTVLRGASPATVSVTLSGSAPHAWHGEATETWSELGADTRVTTTSAWGTTLITATALASTGLVALLSELRAGIHRQRTARLLLHSGWRRRQVTGYLLRRELPGAALLLGLAAGAVAVSTRLAVPAGLGSGAAATAFLYVLVLGLLVLAQVSVACRPATTRMRLQAGDMRQLPTTARAYVPAPDTAPATTTPAPHSTRAAAVWHAVRLGVARTRPSAALTTSAAVVLAALAGAGFITVLETFSQRAGFSELASSVLRVSRLATGALVLLSLAATLSILVSTLRHESGSSQRAHRLLAASGWLRQERVLCETARWAWEHLPVTLLLPVTVLTAVEVGVLSGQAGALALACAGSALILVLTTRVLVILACDRPEEALRD
ncbi:hypothetical protein [Actinomyces faecalis]|uniref:hypothetical protein n=1 Tax=Actinomyces faecalis TaxID=2722820 RepID=UPI0015532004|nr:hypothetical protein [Actinomyces faecalis]